MIRVIVTEMEYRKAENVFKNAEEFQCIAAPAEEGALAAKIRETGARCAIVGTTKYRGPLYDALAQGGVLVRFGVGHDGIDKALAATRGILCCNTPGVLDDSVAECAIGLMLACARHIAACSAAAKNGIWSPRLGRELSGKTVAVIGCGNIGRKVARIAQLGFGMTTIGHGIREPVDRSFLDSFTCDFAEAVAPANVVSLHIPETASNRNFLNLDRLKKMKPSAILINTARGGVLDEDALYDAVESGVIAGAGLDVFRQEPYQPQNSGKDLRTLENVLMTPHLGSSTQEACDRIARVALNNISLALAGRTKDIHLLVG